MEVERLFSRRCFRRANYAQGRRSRVNENYSFSEAERVRQLLPRRHRASLHEAPPMGRLRVTSSFRGSEGLTRSCVTPCDWKSNWPLQWFRDVTESFYPETGVELVPLLERARSKLKLFSFSSLLKRNTREQWSSAIESVIKSLLSTRSSERICAGNNVANNA